MNNNKKIDEIIKEAAEKKSIYTLEGITDFMRKVNKEVYGIDVFNIKPKSND